MFTPLWEWFETYETEVGGEVNLGDNHSCQVKGVGTIGVRMYDGYVRTLTQVRPELNKHFVSLFFWVSREARFWLQLSARIRGFEDLQRFVNGSEGYKVGWAITCTG